MSNCGCGPPEPGLKAFRVSYGENWIRVWAIDGPAAKYIAAQAPFEEWEDGAYDKDYRYEVKPDD